MCPSWRYTGTVDQRKIWWLYISQNISEHLSFWLHSAFFIFSIFKWPLSLCLQWESLPKILGWHLSWGSDLWGILDGIGCFSTPKKSLNSPSIFKIPKENHAGWWFGTFLIFPYIGNDHPNWRTHIFQRGRSTTNQHGLVRSSLGISTALGPWNIGILLPFDKGRWLLSNW